MNWSLLFDLAYLILVWWFIRVQRKRQVRLTRVLVEGCTCGIDSAEWGYCYYCYLMDSGK